jgi:molybdate transport repressor ModE-like protein
MDDDERRGNRQHALADGGRASGLEVRQLRALVALVDHGSVTAAARALGVAQSTVSEALLALERALGTPALVRRRGAAGGALTPAGGALLPYARRVLAALEEAQAAVAAVARDARASVEVLANESVSTYLLPGALGALRRRWPNTRFAVTVGVYPTLAEGLASGRYDVGLLLQTGPGAPPGGRGAAADEGARGRALRLGDVPLVVFCRAEHPLAARAAGAAVPRARLAPYTVLVSDARGPFFELLRDFLRADGLPGPRLEPAGSVEAVRRGVLRDPVALGVLPAYALAAELRAGAVRALPLRPAVPPVRLEALLCRTGPPAHPAVAELLDALRTAPGDGAVAPGASRSLATASQA